MGIGLRKEIRRLKRLTGYERYLATRGHGDPSLEDQVTAGINFINFQSDFHIRRALMIKHQSNWIREWEARKQTNPV